MGTKKRMMHLGLFLFGTGHHFAGWRYPGARADGAVDIAFLQQVAAALEKGKFDFLFLGDRMATAEGYHPSTIARLEPFTLLANLAAVTRRIGLVATASTTYGEPYTLARQLASLDHVSGGRAAWNIVTTGDERTAANFGKAENMEHALRYERAQEFVQVVKGLWDSWEDDAFPRDPVSGVFADPHKMHTLDHRGAHFSVRGPLNVPRAPQGYPVLVQAGSSDVGQELGATAAEVIFTAQENLEDAKAFYAEIKGRLARHGRSPDELVVMPGASVLVGRTEREAKETFARLQSLTASGEVDLTMLSGLLGHELSGYPLDGPLPDLPESNRLKSRNRLLIELARRERFTIRQLHAHVSATRGYVLAIGSPEQVADRLEEWFAEKAADGFNIMPPYMPGALDDFIELVVPELQKRGLFRTDYEGRTLREHLGLARPAFAPRRG